MNADLAFVPYRRTSRYLDLIGPLFEHRDEPAIVGLTLDERHTNSRGMVHAGLLVALADTVMGHNIERALDGPRVVTVSLTTDFVGSAQAGDWIEGRATVRRAGRRVAFGACEFHAGERLVLAASAVFAVTAGAG